MRFILICSVIASGAAPAAADDLHHAVVDIRPLLLEAPDYRAVFSDLRSDDLYGTPATRGEGPWDPVQPEAAPGLTAREPVDDPVDVVLSLIYNSVAADSWDVNGGTGRMEVFGGQLVIANTPGIVQDTRELIELLKAVRTTRVVVEIYFVVLPQRVRAADGCLDPEAFGSMLTELGDAAVTSRIRVSGFDGQRVMATSGAQVNVQIGQQAVVASGAGVLQPIERQLTDGLTVEVQPVLDRQSAMCLMDLRAAIGRLEPRPALDETTAEAGSTTPAYRIAHFAASVSIPLDRVSCLGTALYEPGREVQLWAHPTVSTTN